MDTMRTVSSLAQPEGLLSLLYLTVSGLCLSSLYYLLIRPRLSPLRHLPAPKQGWVWFRMLHEPRVPEIEKWIDTIPNKGLIRYHGIFNRERIFVVSPEAAKDLLSGSAYKYIKPELQWVLANNIAGQGLLIQEGEEHKQARKRFNPAFSPAQMKKWFPSLWGKTVETLDHVAEQIQKSEPVPTPNSIDTSMSGVTGILKPVSAASIDMIGRFGFNIDFDSLKKIGQRKSKNAPRSTNPRDRFSKAYTEMFKTTKRGQLTLEAASLIGPNLALSLPIPAVKTIASIMALVRRTAEGVVEEHEAGFSCDKTKVHGQDDMLSMIMKTGHFSHQDLVEQTVHFFAAGTETVAATACWAIHLLSRYPKLQARLRKEIRENVSSPYLSSPDSVSDAQFHKLKYLNAVIQEVLRYHSINTLLWRECIEPATIAGVPIAKGTKIVFSPWTLNRDPAHWGPTARSFDPERWMDSTTGGADHDYSFLTFGAGPRRCIGERYARDELLCLVGGLVGRYDFAPIAPHMESDEGQEIGDNFALTLFKIYEGWELKVNKVPGW